MKDIFNCYSIVSLSLSVTFTCVYGGKILFHPLLGEGSHYYVQQKLAVELTKRGHNVTVLVDARFEDPVKAGGKKEGFKVEIYQSPSSLHEYKQSLENVTRLGLNGKYVNFMLERMMNADSMQREVDECINLLGDTKLVSNLKRDRFDVAVADSSSLCPFVQYMKIPHVIMAPDMSFSFRNLLAIRCPFYPSYMPELTTALDHNMSFMDRLKNTEFILLVGLVTFGYSNPFTKVLDKYDMGGKSLLQALFADAEIWLVNTDFVLDFPRPLLPNMMPVGGLTSSPSKPLSGEWEEFLQSAGDDGVILFSMGSYATGIDADVAAMFAGAFSQLPQKVIWKLNGEPSAKISPNVKVVDWIPQNDLLAHPKIKVFVNHCGLNGIWEAVYHGVPMVAIPLFADQLDNAARIVSRGMGVKVDIATLTSDELADAIRTVISDKSYKETATRMSIIFRDRRRTPVEEAADWIEYVIRHDGAKHLRSAALDLNVYQYLLLDVIAVLLVALLTVLAISICFCRLCFRGCRKLSKMKMKSE